MLCGMWDFPGPGLEPVSPALAGGFLTTMPPGRNLLGQALPNYVWRTKSSLPPVFINKVLLEYNHAHSMATLLQHQSQDRLCGLRGLKYLLSDPLRKSLLSPSLEQEKAGALEPVFVCSTKKLLRTSGPSEGNSGVILAPFSLQCF